MRAGEHGKTLRGAVWGDANQAGLWGTGARGRQLPEVGGGNVAIVGFQIFPMNGPVSNPEKKKKSSSAHPPAHWRSVQRDAGAGGVLMGRVNADRRASDDALRRLPGQLGQIALPAQVEQIGRAHV